MEFLEMKNITKTFPGVVALDNVNFSTLRGEVHALVGENGAGKSTLVKVLGGIHEKDSGEMFLDGDKYEPYNPRDAFDNGISIIHQELNLIGSLNAVENIFMGRQTLKNRLGFIDWKVMQQKANSIFQELEINIDMKTSVSRLGVARQQMVEIARALSYDSRIIVMDEPTSSLSAKEVGKLFEVVEGLSDEGVSIVFISHKLEEIKEIADRVTVLRNGNLIGTRDVEKVTQSEVSKMMVGKEIEDSRYVKIDQDKGEELLRVESLTSAPSVKNVSLSVKSGEILGIAGLVGAGRTEVARAIVGADKKDSGDIFLRGEKIEIDSPAEAAKKGIGLIPEERKTQGIIPGMNVKGNITITILDKLSRLGFLNKSREKNISEKLVEKLDIRLADLKQPAKDLSGGNQQKVVLAKWFAKDCDVLIFDEPTRGIDVGAKIEIYNLINELVGEGKGVIMISSEMEEVLNMSDRIIVIDEGKVVAEFDSDKATKEKIMDKIIGKAQGMV